MEFLVLDFLIICIVISIVIAPVYILIYNVSSVVQKLCNLTSICIYYILSEKQHLMEMTRKKWIVNEIKWTLMLRKILNHVTLAKVSGNAIYNDI